MATKVKPLADRVLVEAAAAEETTKGGIIIPDTAKEKPQRGKVIATGTGLHRLRPGMVLMSTESTGTGLVTTTSIVTTIPMRDMGTTGTRTRRTSTRRTPPRR